MPRVLVTGASGFVGPHVARALEGAGHDVVRSDRDAANGPVQQRCDLTDAAQVRRLVEDTRPERVVHLAAVSSVARSFEEPQYALHTNLLAACNLLEALRSIPDVRVLMIGSAEQYGNVPREALPVAETQPLAPTSPYAVSKVAQEHLALVYVRAHGLHVVLTRSFNHSGPGQSDAFVLASFARQIAEAEAGRREPVLQVGNLDVERDFLDVRDVAAAYVRLLEHGAAGEAYNVCRGRSHPLRHLLELLTEEARVKMHVTTDAARMRPADLPVLCGDPSKLRAATGWEPQHDMRAMLRAVLDDWRARITADGTVS